MVLDKLHELPTLLVGSGILIPEDIFGLLQDVRIQALPLRKILHSIDAHFLLGPKVFELRQCVFQSLLRRCRVVIVGRERYHRVHRFVDQELHGLWNLTRVPCACTAYMCSVNAVFQSKTMNSYQFDSKGAYLLHLLQGYLGCPSSRFASHSLQQYPEICRQFPPDLC